MSNESKRGRDGYYVSELSLLLAVAFHCNSLVIISDCFLPYNFSWIIVLASVACCYLLLCQCVEMNNSFYLLFWHDYLLIAAHLSTCIDSSKWDLFRGRLYMLLGLAGLSLYFIFMWLGDRKRHQEQELDKPEQPPILPLAVTISFVFLGNGMAMLGRGLIPGDSIVWMLAGGGVMFFISAAFFYYYSSTVSSRRAHHLKSK